MCIRDRWYHAEYMGIRMMKSKKSMCHPHIVRRGIEQESKGVVEAIREIKQLTGEPRPLLLFSAEPPEIVEQSLWSYLQLAHDIVAQEGRYKIQAIFTEPGREDLRVNVKLFKADQDICAISTEKVSGNKLKFMDFYLKLSQYVEEELQCCT
eukprot:TRINITY_DN27275_c0_g1_i6.p2 TRINITY_DN27275_c0_g1~~TRINITY_DN27275_c0_g1_i6.p2  ORF type:complete len:152 (-),score=16.47 TRINITY_DN27275_c0_g1_i6:211-666(-)